MRSPGEHILGRPRRRELEIDQSGQTNPDPAPPVAKRKSRPILLVYECAVHPEFQREVPVGAEPPFCTACGHRMAPRDPFRGASRR